MQPRLWISMVFLITFSAYFTAFFSVKKSDKKLNALLWLPLQLLLSYGLIALSCAVVNFILPINLLTVSVICAVWASVFWYLVLNKGQQRYSLKIYDALAFVIFVAIAVFYALSQFGGDLLPIYETSDPSVHMQNAIKLMQTQKLETMFFAPLINALSFELFGVIVSEVAYFKLFILTDIAFFALSGIMMYSAMALWAKNTKYKLCATFLAAAYMLGYPLNNMVFGFVYLGISITLIITLIAIVRCYLNDELNHNFSIFYMMILCFSISICYSLFVPLSFVSLLIVGIIRFAKQKKLFTLDFVFEQLKIFLIPSALFLWYVFLSKSGHSVSALSIDGYIYKDLYSNFFLLLPPTIFAVYRAIKKKTIGFTQILFILTFAAMICIFLLGLEGVFSAYYYYKFYYLLWAACFYLTYVAINELGEENLSFVVTSFACLATAFIVAITGMDAAIQDITLNFNPSSGAYKLFDIYHFNEGKIIENDNNERRQEWRQKLELYYYVCANDLNENNQVMIAANWQQTYWYEGITAQLTDIYYWHDPELTMQTIAQSDYVVVLYGSDIYEENKQYFSNLEVVVANDIGFVAKV